MSKIKVFLLSAVALSAICIAFETWAMEPEDPLFPTTSAGQRQIKAGLALVKKFDVQDNFITDSSETYQRTYTCDTDFTDPTLEDKAFLPNGIVCPENYNKGFDPFCRAYLGLCVGYGGAKIAIKLSQESPTVVLLGPNKVTARKEYEAYEILNAFGLISQQNPDIVMVAFNNGVIFKDILSVASFDFLTSEDTQRRTWDTKNYKAFGDISIFNGEENYKNVEYNCRLLFPLVRDMTLWYLIGTPGNIIDSPNLIFKQTNKNEQTICRLFLYDIYSKGSTKDDDMFEELKRDYTQITCTNERKNNIASSVKYNTKRLYRNIYEAMTSKEKTELWGETESKWRGYSFRIKEEDLDTMWKKLEPLILQECTDELTRLIPLFNELNKDSDY